ncbi:hypothetical protein [Gimesia chilikensis]|uniref:hypothetical protein n=1 Tax=Gimesia chilikensis TaxID=2605989 RepID=UPI001187E3D2|nr:hypothetical protein [Gimesia chilikensis]QDT87140.1 hypothetical protein MalM14_48250 [Gimesia chilikensis]
MEITLDEIRRWANTSDLDERFAQLQEEDPDLFEVCVLDACDDQTLLEFARNRESTKRQYFITGLVQRLVYYLYSFHSLPYEFSRLQGMISLDEYKSRELDRMENVYQHCRIVETMRNSDQNEIKNLGNMILDYRHDRYRSGANTTKLLQLLDYQIKLSFRPGVTTYVTRLCKLCDDEFKSWLISGGEIETEKCPFCVLKISYPQKYGKKSVS